jgi:hypothetical protein
MLFLIYAGILALLIFIGIVLFLQNKHMTKYEKEAMEKVKVFPLWYYVGVFTAALLTLGPLNEKFKAIGCIIFAALILLGWNWKYKNK